MKVISGMERMLNPRPVLPAERQFFSDGVLKAMIVPLLIEQLLQLVVGIADTMMVSYAGEATVSGVSLDTMIYTVFNRQRHRRVRAQGQRGGRRLADHDLLDLRRHRHDRAVPWR